MKTIRHKAIQCQADEITATEYAREWRGLDLRVLAYSPKDADDAVEEWKQNRVRGEAVEPAAELF